MGRLSRKAVFEKLSEVIDPELGINIVDLGLVYEITISEEGKVEVLMSLTTPGCPLAGVFEEMVSDALEKIDGVKKVEVKLTFDPPWTAEMMSEEARAELGFD